MNLRAAFDLVRSARLGSSLAITAAAVWSLCLVLPSSTETAVANGDTRTLHLFHTHTGETIDATFRVDGHYDPAVLSQLNHFLRDWRNNDEISMDPRLFDAVWEAYRSAGATDRIQIYSAYRSPETNAMLRRRSRAVAEHSQHMLGKAMDTTMPGFPMDRIRDAGMKLQHGGVGWYPSANFVHLDVGGVRSWPRMPYDQLASLFPDGKTVHIASNGQTLPGYEQARIELAQRGDAADLPPSQSSGGFFAWLFGGGSNTAGAAHEDEEDRRATAVAVAPQARPAVEQQQAVEVAQSAPEQPATEVAPQAAPSPAKEPVQVASLEPTDISPIGGVLPMPPRRPASLAAAPEIPLPPTRPTTLGGIETASIRFSDAQALPVPRPRDDIASLITSTTSGVPMIRKAALPSIITQGSRAGERHVAPSQALAFAATDSIGDTMVQGRGGMSVHPIGLRGPRKHGAGSTSAALLASDEPVSGGFTGLRRAVHLMSANASL